MNKLTREQWYELDEQMSHTPPEADAEGVPGEHIKLIAPLNKFGFTPMSKHAALVLAEKLLNEGWDNNERIVSVDAFLQFQTGYKNSFFFYESSMTKQHLL